MSHPPVDPDKSRSGRPTGAGCRYYMPREVFGPGFAFTPHTELLRLEEIVRAVTAFARP